MIKLHGIIILFSIISISCNFQNKEETKIKSNNENYSNTNLGFMDGLIPINKDLIHRPKIEIGLDSNGISTWKLNGEKIKKSELVSKLEDIQLYYHNKKINNISIDLGINKVIEIREFIELRDSLRIGNYLKGSYLNSDNQRLNVRFPISHNMRPSKLIPLPPPMPPGIEDLICLCCEKGGKFRTSVLKFQSKFFENYSKCMKGSNLSESYSYVHIEKDKFYWEGNELNLLSIEDSLQTKYNNYSNPKRYITILKIDSLSKFDSYFHLYSVCRKVYVKKWNEESLKMFGSSYKDLSIKEMKTVRRKYPLIITEYFD